MKNWFRHIGLRFDRSFSKGLYKQVLWLVGLMALVYLLLVALSYLRTFYAPEGVGSQGRWYDILFVLMDPGSTSVSMAPAFVVLVALVGLVVFSGMLISLISNVLERRVENFLNGETDYKVKGHVIILGYNRSIPSLLKEVHRQYKDSFIVLMSERATSDVRECIHATVPSDVEKYVILLNGMRYAEEDLKRLSLTRGVKEIYVLGEEDEAGHDTINLECVKKMAGMLPAATALVPCHVQIDSHTVFSVLQSVDFADTELNDGSFVRDRIKFLPFNFNEIWSQKALATIPHEIESGGGKALEYFPLDGKGITSDSSCHVHLIIVGMNDMATSLALNAAHILHFPNFQEGDFSTCSHITFIDREARLAGQDFRNRYRHLFLLSRWRQVTGGECLDADCAWVDPWDTADFPYRHLGEKNFMDIQWEFIEGEVADDNIQAYLEACSCHDGEITTIALCEEDSERNAELCLALPESICRSASAILVRQKQNPVTVDMIRSMPHHDKVRPFGLMSECYRENLISDRFGKLINACYFGIDFSCADKVEEAWRGCRSLDKWSSVYCTNMLYVKLRSMGLADESQVTKDAVEALVGQAEIKKELQRTEHYRWVTEKLLLGFSPLTAQEKQTWDAADKATKKAMKSMQKHGLICSNWVLPKEEREKDDAVNSNLWKLYQQLKGRADI